ncbi:MAG: serine hydrolase, partial [Gemmatimonadetes bacterium]|nr:beta-lactamase family protein [Gemmatimonadota bacterium]NIR81159.1 beta-lactamase family protein [Gemmatimonadota bacterium]NIT89990.1 beta-lactamase family protein [Gemmatimonadota bacterium]NIU33797.1 beta-lactamase family protein [Gemmatimonadota bacterium]NIU38022.1 serine hydrolase [Gemmatimonadota bacterium]
PAPVYDTLLNEAWEARSVVAGVFVPPRSGAGEVDVSPEFARFVRSVAVHRPAVVVSYGSPYLLDGFPEVGSYLLAWGGREVSQEAGVRALLGAAPISGTLPISLPPFHGLREGLRREALPGVEGVAPAPDPLSEAGILPAGRPDAAAGEAPDTAADAGPPLPPLYASAAEADPGSGGMSTRELARLDTLILEAVRDSASPGAALAVARRGRLVRLRGYGRTDWAPDAPPATPTTLYDLASLTKVVGTTTAAMLLVDEGHLELDAPVVRYLPWWAGGDARKEEVTVRQLLLHRAGLPPFRRFFLEMEGRTAYRRAIGALSLEYAPGSRTVYSDIGMMTLAFVIEEITGRGLDAFLRERVWRPLGMLDTGFRPEPERRVRVAPTEVDTLYRETHVHGEVHDENAYALGGVAGHAGLFSTAADLAVFAATVLAGGAIEACPAGPPRPGAAAGGGDTARAAGPRA